MNKCETHSTIKHGSRYNQIVAIVQKLTSVICCHSVIPPTFHESVLAPGFLVQPAVIKLGPVALAILLLETAPILVAASLILDQVTAAPLLLAAAASLLDRVTQSAAPLLQAAALLLPAASLLDQVAAASLLVAAIQSFIKLHSYQR
jgi:hypothetical protein